MIRRPAPRALSSQTRIAGEDEPGEPLIVYGNVLAPNGQTRAESVTAYAYNTDSQATTARTTRSTRRASMAG